MLSYLRLLFGSKARADRNDHVCRLEETISKCGADEAGEHGATKFNAEVVPAASYRRL